MTHPHTSRILRRAASAALTVQLLLPLVAGAQGETPFLRVRVDEARNRALLDIPASQLNKDFLHQVSLGTGLGNGALDRAQSGPDGIVRLERRGNRVLMVRDNFGVRAPRGDAANQRAAIDAYPRSIVGSLPIEKDTAGVLTVDATSLFLADAYGVADVLRAGGSVGGTAAGAGVGTYRVDASRSYIDGSRTKAFPRNSEVHAVLTFVTDQPARGRGIMAPDARALTFEEHHSFVMLPDTAGYRPRNYDPRFGYGGVSFFDLSQGLDGNYRGGFINRWRLVPKDPAAYARGELVEPVTPITYYLDPAIPAPYREAFREGGNWWAKVYEAAGFKNAFRVLDLPADADPRDVRYSVLNWVHRTNPGPSYAGSLEDPRTGEIIRAMIAMDTWRSLVDYNIWAGTVPASDANGPNVDAETFAMARRRQHTAHEIGHSLGLQHNYIASTQGRASVMEYPFPFITLDANGRPDLRDAYRKGPGAWDTLAIRLGYTWFPDAGAEQSGLDRIMRDGIAKNVRFINDRYANANGSNPLVTRWEEGTTPFEGVQRTAGVRRVLIDNFDERAIKPGEPMHLLNMRFAHVYLHHRYSLEALSKYIGGMDFTFALRGDNQKPTTVIPAADQRKALGMLLDAISPKELTVPEKVQRLIPPPPPGFNTDQTWITGSGDTMFDAITLGGGLATEVIGYILDRDRAARVVHTAATDTKALSLTEVTDAIVQRTWGAALPVNPSERAMLRASQRAALDALLDLGGDARALPDVRAAAVQALKQIEARLAKAITTDDAQRAHIAAGRVDLARFFAGDDVPAKRPRYPVITLPWP